MRHCILALNVPSLTLPLHYFICIRIAFGEYCAYDFLVLFVLGIFFKFPMRLAIEASGLLSAAIFKYLKFKTQVPFSGSLSA